MLQSFDFVKSVFELRKGKGSGAAKAFGALECEGTESWIVVKAIITGIATFWGCLQIVNMIGETTLEVSETGFQILHGWTETVVSLIIGDIPQAGVAVLLGATCTIDSNSLAQAFVWMVVKFCKNSVRKSTCKQEKIRDCCGDCCCVYEYDIACVCKLVTIRLCSCCCEEMDCVTVDDYDCCPSCSGGVKCCGEITEDPDWAKMMASKLGNLYLIACAGYVAFPILKEFGIL